MKPNWYFDLEMPGTGREEGLFPAPMRNRLLGILHAFFSEHPHTYAIALPKERTRLRVFASELGDLDRLVDYLRPQRWIRDYVRLNYPLAVEENFSGPWQSFRRYRIPSASSDRKTGDEHGLLRQKRMQKAMDGKMEYFIMRSRSTGQAFSFFIERLPGTAPRDECLPNSYGFAVSTRPFSLPDIP